MPLAARMRPRHLDEYVGQQHILGPDKPLRKALTRGHLHSMVLWGPPGTGKTTLAELMAAAADAHVERVSAVTSGVKEIRTAIDAAKTRAENGLFRQKTILFVDEVHRFNKSQQDAFLPHIEDGTIIFVGATTENPGFALNNALLSRARTYRLQALTIADLEELMTQALHDTERGLGHRRLTLTEDGQHALLRASAGDARRLLNSLEIAADFVTDGGELDAEIIVAATGQTSTAFDNKGDLYYDLLSAFHKSVRGSSPDGALYWYCRILAGGGDPLIVARRLLAIASEDIGNADPRALQIALNAWDTYQRVGPAEGERAIAQATLYCASAAKSNAVYQAFNQMLQIAKEGPDYAVPEHLRNAPTTVHKQEGFGADYRYAHDYDNAYVAGEAYLPPELAEQQFYQPEGRGLEIKIKEKLDYLQQVNASSEWQRYKKT